MSLHSPIAYFNGIKTNKIEINTVEIMFGSDTRKRMLSELLLFLLDVECSLLSAQVAKINNIYTQLDEFDFGFGNDC